jgi:hypothetical protein
MVHVNGFWDKFLADAGNEAGAQQGDVEVHFVSRIAGMDSVTCPR